MFTLQSKPVCESQSGMVDFYPNMLISPQLAAYCTNEITWQVMFCLTSASLDTVMSKI